MGAELALNPEHLATVHVDAEMDLNFGGSCRGRRAPESAYRLPGVALAGLNPAPHLLLCVLDRS